MGNVTIKNVLPPKIKIFGKDIRINDYIEGLSPDSMRGPIVYIEDYTGPLSHLFANGARIVYWPSTVFIGRLTGQTVGNDDLYNIWRFTNEEI